jgi:hypothetical protein
LKVISWRQPLLNPLIKDIRLVMAPRSSIIIHQDGMKKCHTTAPKRSGYFRGNTWPWEGKMPCGKTHHRANKNKIVGKTYCLIYIYTYIYIYAYTIYVYIYIHICICVNISVYIIYMCIYIYACMCIYIYIHIYLYAY